MGKRDDRLRSPEAFKQALMTRPVSRKGSFLVYRVVSPDGPRIGFVIPKKLVRNAVWRNQIKRWARAMFRNPDQVFGKSFAFVIRVHQSLPANRWLANSRQQTKEELGAALHQALCAD